MLSSWKFKEKSNLVWTTWKTDCYALKWCAMGDYVLLKMR